MQNLYLCIVMFLALKNKILFLNKSGKQLDSLLNGTNTLKGYIYEWHLLLGLRNNLRLELYLFVSVHWAN